MAALRPQVVNAVFIAAGLFWGCLLTVSFGPRPAHGCPLTAQCDEQGLSTWGIVRNAQLMRAGARAGPEIIGIAMGTSPYTQAEAIARLEALWQGYRHFVKWVQL